MPPSRGDSQGGLGLACVKNTSLGFGFRVFGFGFRVLGLGFRKKSTGGGHDLQQRLFFVKNQGAVMEWGAETVVTHIKPL